MSSPTHPSEATPTARPGLRLSAVPMLPMPVALVGSEQDGRPNFMAAGWVTQVNAAPPLLAVAIRPSRLTAEAVQAAGCFSLGFPRGGQAALADYCGVVSGRDRDKAAHFTLFRGETGAPMAAECPLNFDCRLVQTLELPTHTLFIGEVVAAYGDEACLSEGRPDFQRMDPLVLTGDGRYRRLGDVAGQAFRDGFELAKKEDGDAHA